MNRSELQERNINIFRHIAFLGLCAGMIAGCSSSKQSVQPSAPAQTTASDSIAIVKQTPKIPGQSKSKPINVPPKKEIAAPQQFSVRADTVDVQRKKKLESQSSPISVKASVPKRFYTVEVGAFRLPSNVNRHKELLGKRFKQPVRVLYDSSIQLTRVSVGTFLKRSAAVEFMKSMQIQFPNDYPDLWVSYWTK